MTRPMMVQSIETKRTALERMASGERASAIAADLGFGRQLLYLWRAKVRQGGLGALRGPGRPRKPAAVHGLDMRDLSDAARRELIARVQRIGGQPDGPR